MSKRLPPGFWPVWLAVLLDLVGFGIVIPLLPLFADSFGAGAVSIGLLFASYSLAQILFAPIWGRLSDRIGRRPVLLVTIAGSAIGSFLLGIAPTLAILFVGRIVDGISGASIAVARAVVADIADDAQRPRLMGLLGAAFGLGFVIGPSLGALAALGGQALPFFAAAGLSVVNFIAAWFRLPETREPAAAPATSEPVWRMRPAPIILRLGVISFVSIVAFSAFEATFGLLGRDRLGLDEAAVAAVFAGLGLLLVLTQGGLIGPLAAWIGEYGLIRLGLVLNAVGFGVLAFATSWAALLAALALLAVGQGLVTPAVSSVAGGAVASAEAGIALGWMQSAGGVARVAGPVIGGALYAVRIEAPYLLSAVLTGVALVLVAGAAAAPAGRSGDATRTRRG